ncbi:MAG: hypothetical protein OXJ90_11640 [Spirochaetaceae bacterium]|nr:hypothetical protein [Spirochaetaceae bacterium]
MLNLTTIDPNEPQADREGPVSLRVNLPVEFHNLYLYVIADPSSEGTKLAFAPKVEMVLGGSEVGFGAYYHPDRVPRAMLTLSSGFLGIDLFGELEVSLGSERRFVEATEIGPENPLGLRTVQYSEQVFTALTGGLRYTYSAQDRDWSATFVGQYLWNGEGYEDSDILRENPLGVGRLLIAGDLHPGDLIFPGRHYAAASIGLSLDRDSEWLLAAFWISNLSDASGRVSPSLTVRPADHFSLRAAASVTYGEEGAEMTPFGSRVTVSIAATLGSGRF